jgi:two-component system alkaline phosphatase synthesis response regulator PhoP
MSSKTSTLHRILVVDDLDITELLSYNLKRENYDVRTANDGKSAIVSRKIWTQTHHPWYHDARTWWHRATGQQLREVNRSKAYLLYLTARSEYSEVAFDVGHDVTTKPIKPRALISRINAFFRKPAFWTQHLIEMLICKWEKHTVTKEEPKPMACPRKNSNYFLLFSSTSNKVCSRDELLQKIWGTDVFVVERTVDVHVQCGKKWKWLHQNLERSWLLFRRKGEWCQFQFVKFFKKNSTCLLFFGLSLYGISPLYW